MKIPVMELGNSKEKADSVFVKGKWGAIKLMFKFNLEELLVLLDREAKNDKP